MKTDNELIAEFMGAIEITPVAGQYDSYWRMYKEDGNTILWDHKVKNLKYRTSWDWLMPVVEKIQSLDEPFSITLGYGHMSNLGMASHYTYCHVENWKSEGVVGCSGRPTLIEAVYATVVEFIKFYNSTLSTDSLKEKKE